MQPDPNAIQISLDGSFLAHRGRKAGYAGHVVYPDSPIDQEIILKGFRESTINRMELAAVIAALEWVRRNQPSATRVQVFSDSLYVIDNIPRARYWQKHKWRNAHGRPIENADLWKGFLSTWSKAGMPVHFGWVKGKSQQLLKKVDAAAKSAAESGMGVDRGYRPGKIGQAKNKAGTATMFPAAGQEIVIRIYWTKFAGRSKESHVRFELYQRATGQSGAKHYAYAQPEIAAELHRHHVYRVRLNNTSKYPQILAVLEEIHLPKTPRKRPASTEPASSAVAAES